MKSVIILFAFLLTATASADQFKTVKYDDSAPNYISEITIQQLLPGTVVAAYQVINQELLADIRSYGCSSEDALEMEMTFDYTVDARIIGLNKNYVSYELSESSYCGGAHPNYTTYYKTFNAKTGQVVDMSAEQVFDFENMDFDLHEKYKQELAQVMYQYGQKELLETGCYEGTKEEMLETIGFFYPYIAGLAANKQVVLAVSVSHVAAPCAVSIRVPVAAVSSFFKKNSEIFSLVNY